MKYELTEETRAQDGVTLHRIRALRDSELSNFHVGDLGGWVQALENLSQDGECWIYADACIWEDACVSGDCRVSDRAEVRGRARLDGLILVEHDALVTDDVVMDGVASVSGYTKIFGSARIHCGEDGPQILSGIWIDFDVNYDQDYAVFSHSRDAGLMIAVSHSGRICIVATWDYEGFSGSLNEFIKWTQSWPPARDLLPAIEDWLARQV